MCRLKRLGLVVSDKEKNLVVTLAKLEGPRRQLEMDMATIRNAHGE